MLGAKHSETRIYYESQAVLQDFTLLAVMNGWRLGIYGEWSEIRMYRGNYVFVVGCTRVLEPNVSNHVVE